jgi:integrase
MYWHEGRRHSAGTFATKADAHAHLSIVEADIRRNSWIDPSAGEVTVKRYAYKWLEQRHDLSVRTRDLYRYVLDRHIIPHLGDASLSALSPARVRDWNAAIAKDHPATAAMADRILSSIMRTALADEIIASSPCKVKGAGTERVPERPVATISEVAALTHAMPEHLQLVVLLTSWCQLRRGEILGLRRRDVDIPNSVITIEQSRTFKMNGESVVKEPKTRAGRRTLAVPHELISVVARHLSLFTGTNKDSLLFGGSDGSPISRDALQGSWERARASIGRKDLRLHDLRHTGLTLSAATGATTAELMHRAGHSSASAAIRYQHATKDRDRVLANALGTFIASAEHSDQ